MSTNIVKKKRFGSYLDNQEAKAYYEQHRSWRGSSRKRAKPLVVAPPVQPPGVKLGRDEQRVRQRYLRMSKEALVSRLLTAERTLAEQRERWLSQPAILCQYINCMFWQYVLVGHLSLGDCKGRFICQIGCV